MIVPGEVPILAPTWRRRRRSGPTPLRIARSWLRAYGGTCVCVCVPSTKSTYVGSVPTCHRDQIGIGIGICLLCPEWRPVASVCSRCLFPFFAARPSLPTFQPRTSFSFFSLFVTPPYQSSVLERPSIDSLFLSVALILLHTTTCLPFFPTSSSHPTHKTFAERTCSNAQLPFTMKSVAFALGLLATAIHADPTPTEKEPPSKRASLPTVTASGNGTFSMPPSMTSVR